MNQNQTCPCSPGSCLYFKGKIYVMYKNLKTWTVECLENGNFHVYRKFCLGKTTFFKMDPSVRKLQEPGNKQNKIKEN